jgi:hypothetical protein
VISKEREAIVKHAVVSQNWNMGPLGQASSIGKVALRLLPLAVLVSSCGGGGGGGESTSLLQVGMQRQYTGTTTRSVVYEDPTATNVNNTLVYTFTENQTVQQAATGAPADFDVHSDYTYTVVTDPGVGTVPISQTVDAYDNLQVADGNQTVISFGQNVVAVSNDETSNALGGGPYTETSTTATTYTTPRDNFPYPLQTGATMTTPQSETQTTTFTDLNATNDPPPDGSDVGYTMNRTENADGSFTYKSTYVNGNTYSRTQNSDGSGSETFTTATGTTATTVGVPVTADGTSTIPIVRTVIAKTAAATNYSAADWYPGTDGAPSSPLVLVSRTVVGPTSTLPAECTGAVVQPYIYEIDTTTTNLSTVGASYSTTTQRNFSAGNGASVCELSTEVSSSYDLLTGALTATTTTTTTTILASINY